MRALFLMFASITLLSGCLRSPAVCGADSDCFASERCKDGSCIPRLALDAAPPAHIAVNDGSEVSRIELEHDSSGSPHIAYIDDGELMYTTWDGAQWRTERVADLQLTDFGILTMYADDDTVVVAATTGVAPDELRLFRKVEDGWDESVVDATDAAFYVGDIAFHNDLLHICYFQGDFVAALDGEELTAHYGIGAFGSLETLTLSAADPGVWCAIEPFGVVVHFVTNTGVSGETDAPLITDSIASDVSTLDFDFEAAPLLEGQISGGKGLAVDSRGTPALAHSRFEPEGSELFLTRKTPAGWRTEVVHVEYGSRFFNGAELFLGDPGFGWIATSTLQFNGSDYRAQFWRIRPGGFDDVRLEAAEEVTAIVADGRPDGSLAALVFRRDQLEVFYETLP